MNVIKEVREYVKNYRGEKGVIGKSLLKQNIEYFAVEKTPFPKVICVFSIHAREYITAHLSLVLAEDFKKRGKKGKVYFVPIANPDGVRIALNKNPLYKANARGVDLNVNFDARWGRGEKNVFTSGAENYIGTRPFSESETKALRDFTLKVSPEATLSFHSKGEEIYYGFYEKTTEKDKRLAQILGKVSGYKVKTTFGSAGGYKDWCVDKLGVSGFTVEVGSDALSHPIEKKHLKEIAEKTRDLIIALTENL